MDAAGLRALQAPIKERYKAEPKAAFITLKAGRDDRTCSNVDLDMGSHGTLRQLHYFAFKLVACVIFIVSGLRGGRA